MVNPVFPGLARKVLSVGSGPVGADARLQANFPASDGWSILRADIDPAVAPDVLASVTDLSCVPEGSFEVAWCSHVLEHLFIHETGTAASELLRILKPGGELFVFVPDLEAAARAVAEGGLMAPLYVSPAGPITPHDVLFGHGKAVAAGRTAMAHRTGFTPHSLGDCLHAAGFDPVVVRRSSEFEISARATKPKGPWSAEQRSYVEQSAA
jgi:SAM-dependent methyltransferase